MNGKAPFAGAAMGMLLVALNIGVPVLTAIFATSGPFGQLQGVAEGTCDWIPTTGSVPCVDRYVIGNAASVSDAQLSDNPYAGILTAVILLIPLAIVAFFSQPRRWAPVASPLCNPFRFFRERF